MNKLFILLILILTSCGTEEFEKIFLPYNDPEFDRFRRFFELHTGADTKRIPINYGDAAGAAHCGSREIPKVSEWNLRRIVINRRNFEAMPEIYRYAVIAHEFVHCKFKKKHHDDYVKGEFVLMAPSMNIAISLEEEELIYQLQLQVN